MPRLTDSAYLDQRSRLGMNWSVYGGDALFELSSNEQWALHHFFAFTKNLTDEQTLAHRALMSFKEPSLPQRAGRALKKIEPYLASPHPMIPVATPIPTRPVGQRRNQRAGERHVTIKTLVRPEIDVQKIVRLLHALAEIEEKRRAQEDLGKAA